MTGSGTSGRRPLQRPTVPIRRGTMPTHRPVGQMRILRRDTWVPPYRVRRSCRTGRRGRRPLQRFIAPVRRGAMPTSPRRTNAHSAAGHMGPALQGTPVMQDGTSGRRPLQRFTVPIRRGTMLTHRPAGQMRILRRDTWVPPYRVRRSCRTGRRDAVPYNGSPPYPSAGGRCPHRPAGSTKRQAQAPASLCVIRLFTWRSWRPHDRRGRPSDSAP